MFPQSITGTRRARGEIRSNGSSFPMISTTAKCPVEHPSWSVLKRLRQVRVNPLYEKVGKIAKSERKNAAPTHALRTDPDGI